MVRIIHDAAIYPALWYTPDLQAYRTDRFEGFVRQPAEVGPVIFSQSSPSYALITPVGGTDAPDTSDGTASDATTAPGDTNPDDSTPAATDGNDDDGGNGALIAVIVGVLVVAGAGAFFFAKRRGSADERE